MKKTTDDALKFSNPYLLGAVYFSLLSIIFSSCLGGLLYLLSIEPPIPFFKAVILAAVVAAIFGAIFGNWIIHCERPYKLKAFFLGFLMVIVALPFYDLGFLYVLEQEQISEFLGDSGQNLMLMYSYVVLFSVLLVGIWLAIVAGFAAIFLRSHFVYDVLHTVDEDDERPESAKPHHNIHLHH